jgi:hypothetical protein
MQPQALGRGPLSCHEFLEGHSDYLDGLLPEGITWRFDQHAAECSNCNRFDRVLRRGLLLARNLPEIQPSATFQDTLQARLMGLEAVPIQRPVIAGTGTAVVIAAVLGMIAITPFLMQAGADHAPPPAVAETPPPTPVMPSLDVNESAFGEPQITAGVFATPPFETSYSPVIVQAPAVAGSVSSVRVIAYPLLLTADR